MYAKLAVDWGLFPSSWRGTTYGKSDKEARRPDSEPVTVQDFNATIGYALGIDSHKILHSPSGRPFRMAGAEKDLGDPVKSIFS